MKLLQIIFLFIALTSMTSCDKYGFNPDYSQGKATAIRNGESWIAQGRGSINNFSIGVDFTFEVFNKAGSLRQGLDFSKIPASPGTYYLRKISGQSQDSIPRCLYSTISDDGDVLEDTYLVYEFENESYLTVSNYDMSNRVLKGEFRIKFFIDPQYPKSNPKDPDTLLFEKGQFEVKIKE